MSSDDAQYAYATLKPLIIALACETGFYVLSILSFVVSTYILVRKGLKTRAILIMWITTFIMFTVSTCHLVVQWVGDVNLIQSQIWALAPYQYTGSNEPADPANYFMEVAESITNVYLPIINYSLSDAIVLWRVWVMWQRSVKVLIFPVLISLGTNLGVGTYIIFTGIGVSLVAIYALTLATNIIATTLIAIKAWQHRRLIISHFNDTEYKSHSISILFLLVESGTLYCVIWIIFLVTLSSNINSITWYVIEIIPPPVFEILPGITVQVSGIYPTAVIALSALQRTTWDMSVGKDMPQNAPHTEMRFVARATRSGTSTTQTGANHLTPSVDPGSHPHASEIVARDGEV